MKEFDDFEYFAEKFDDIRILRYKLPGFDLLPIGQKVLIYYLSQAAFSGRDILWDQNFRFNLKIRKTIEAIFEYYSGDRSTGEFTEFLLYSKKVLFSNGIHHHYSNDKIIPGFTKRYFACLIKDVGQKNLPLESGQTEADLISNLTPVIFDKKLYGRKVEQEKGS